MPNCGGQSVHLTSLLLIVNRFFFNSNQTCSKLVENGVRGWGGELKEVAWENKRNQDFPISCHEVSTHIWGKSLHHQVSNFSVVFLKSVQNSMKDFLDCKRQNPPEIKKPF